MKKFSLSKKDLQYMGPLDATLNGLNVALQVYVINTVFKRLAIDPKTQARYDIDKGELYVVEPEDLKPRVPPTPPPVKSVPPSTAPTK